MCKATAPPVMRSNSTREKPARASAARVLPRREICGSIPAGTNTLRASPRSFLRPAAARASRRIRRTRGRRIRRLREFENRSHSAGLQHAQHLFQAALVVRQVAKSEGHGDQIERSVRQRQRQRIGFEQRRAESLAAILRRASTSMGWQKSLPAGIFPHALPAPAPRRRYRSTDRAPAHPDDPESPPRAPRCARASACRD